MNVTEIYNLGVEAYEKGDFAAAVKYFKQAAEQGDLDACNHLSVCYIFGEGVDENPSEAFKWYMKAAEQGLDIAQYNLGTCYCLGEGVKKNNKESLKWFTKSAENGYAPAQFMVGLFYEGGLKGVIQPNSENKEIAKEWYIKAAKQGFEGAKERLLKKYKYSC